MSKDEPVLSPPRVEAYSAEESKTWAREKAEDHVQYASMPDRALTYALLALTDEVVRLRHTLEQMAEREASR